MKRDSPAPKDILEELADNTAEQVERLAPVAFDNTFSEMLAYHRFLLALSASRTPDGSAVSFAEVMGDAWIAPHHEWSRQYSRLFERAANRLRDDDHFIRALAYTPGRLLPGRSDPELPASVIASLLGLGPTMIHRLERWLQKSAEGGSAGDTGVSTPMHFAAADTSAYENVLPEIVGAWETLLLKVPSLYGWEDSSQLSEVERWLAYGKSWRFLWTHLEKTATSLAIAVWNEDGVGSRYFQDTLLRWPEAYEFRFAEEAQLHNRRLLFPDILNRKWHEARAQAVSLSFVYAPEPSPENIFASILRSAHEDVLLLTAALLLSWTVNGKHSTDIGARTASGILRRESSQDHSFGGREREFGFRSLFLHFLRLRIAGERSEKDSYAARLDALVEALDSMTERPVVPGRVYAPSTLHDRQGLRLSTVAVLAATAPLEGDDGLMESVRSLAKDEHLLPCGDRSLRSVVDEVSAWRSTIEDQTHTQVTRGASLLFSSQDCDSLIAKLQNLVTSAEETIESERVARMTIRPIDAAKLERFRAAVETDLFAGLKELSYFREFKLEGVVGEEGTYPCEVPFGPVQRAWLTDPPMDSLPINFDRGLVSSARRKAARTVWNAFVRRSRTRRDVSAWDDGEMFWSEIAPLILAVGPDPALVVSRSAEGRALRRSRHTVRNGPPKIRIEWRSELQSFSPYVGTFEGVDVFDGDFPARKAWLFSARNLLCVRYTKQSGASNYVDASYEPSDDRSGTLRLRFSMSCEWSTSPIFELYATENQDS